MTPAQLSRTVLRSVREAVADGELSVPLPERVAVKRPSGGGRGDYATAVALQLARPAGLPPLGVAGILRSRLAAAPGIERVEITGPGFLNVTLADESGAAVVRGVLRRGLRYGHAESPDGPPGAVDLVFPAEVRATVVADVLRRLLGAQGVSARLRCAGVPEGEWGALGVDVRAVAPAAGPAVAPAIEPSRAPSVGGARPAVSGQVGEVRGEGDAVAVTGIVAVRPVPAADSAAGLLAVLGPDAARWALLRPAAHGRPGTGQAVHELLVQRETNPLFRVRYAHARTRALLRNAADLDIRPVPGDPGVTGATGTAVASASCRPGSVRELLAAIGDHPAVLEAAARHREPDRVARHLERVADAFFRFHDDCPVLPRGDEKPTAAHRARAALVEAAGTVLAGGLHLLGIDAPDHL
ncbi:ArgS-related anticodon-binding protein NrtL [Streptomyces zingiberis]|uniref:arginine--tRNA ligase n=1 Tax=Streptomyces zingiberis TaxID=2053010 RepID=A0ABX1BWN4_9ACTN|nr:DALR anticodon-binding domain-containing protein [Streptomyces zingiberis]NJQ00823.1 arginine--tRNA ligase [Streptomyces zingiberis]